MNNGADRQPGNEVLVFDSSTFLQEVGLTSGKASVLRHYLCAGEMQLMVPQTVVEECERHLKSRAEGKVKSVIDGVGWLARFFGGVDGWKPPAHTQIINRVAALSHGESFMAVVLQDTPELKRRAEERCRAERPPSHKKPSPGDCRIWEHCLELLKDRDVVFVSNDGDFRGHRQPNKLHPQLQVEADAVDSGGVLTFHPGMQPLLSEMKAEVKELPTDTLFEFIYKAAAVEVSELELNSEGYRPTSTGSVEQQLFTTNQADIVEIRLKMKDPWKRPETVEHLAFELSGSCQYHLPSRELRNLSTTRVGLYMADPDGTKRAVKGSSVYLSATLHLGRTLMTPEPYQFGVEEGRSDG